MTLVRRLVFLSALCAACQPMESVERPLEDALPVDLELRDVIFYPAPVAGQTFTYRLNIVNNGAATTGLLSTQLPDALEDVVWICTSFGGASCAAPIGVGVPSPVPLSLGSALSGPSEVQYVFQGRIKSNAEGPLQIRSIVEVDDDLVPENNESLITLDVIAISALQLSMAGEAGECGALEYTLTVENLGPSDAREAFIEAPLPPTIAQATWSCAAEGGASCGAASGEGDILEVASIPLLGRVVYTITAQAAPGAAEVSSSATVSAPSSIEEEGDTASLTLLLPESGDCEGEDEDGDGVLNQVDLCPFTPPGLAVDQDGCSGAQRVALACPEGSFSNHGRYVSCVAHAAREALLAGLLSPEEKALLVSQAAHSR